MIDIPNLTNKAEPRKLKRNEIILSKNSKTYKLAVSQTKKRLDELESQESLSELEVKELDFLKDSVEKWNYYTAWFRNPVPNTENLWVYKIVLAEDVWLNTARINTVKSNDVILHPESTYVKLQWDNDWDKAVFNTFMK